MRVLFVSSGNSKNVSPIVQSQGVSLTKLGNDVEYYTIIGKGLIGYLNNIRSLKRVYKQGFDVVHSHYGHSAMLTTLIMPKRHIVSLMGGDVNSANIIFLSIIKILARYFWDHTIVKSISMKKKLGYDNAIILPNGVDLDLFRPLNKDDCIKELEWDLNDINILFAADPQRSGKNFELFINSFQIAKNKYPNLTYHTLRQIPHNQIPLYINASNLICLTSLAEGSPNVIKESMACNKPILSTNVGDVKMLFKNTNGNFISNSFISSEYSNLLCNAIEYSLKNPLSDGRKRVIELELDSKLVARKLVEIYKIK